MVRESHLFSCHKFLEAVGSQILIHLAKVDLRDLQEIGIIRNQVDDYITTIGNHARWEEEFIFRKFFTKHEVSVFFGEHSDLENQGKQIIEKLTALLNLDTQSRICKGKQVYLDFRIFYAANLTHFHSEETNFLSLLQERATDDEVRAIDKPIYQSMSSSEIIEMIERLLPPTNIFEKKNILDDLRRFNSDNFEYALPKIRDLFTMEEAAEIFGE